MEITNATQSGSPSSTTATPDTTQNLGAEFDTFLTLLTAQIRNQDPLAPLDSTQFVEQLATFTSLEQQVQGNQFLENISTSISELMSLAASDWIGQTVEVESAFVPFEGQPVSFNAEIPDQAEQAILRVVNSAGDMIDSQDLDLDDNPWQWNGTTSDGTSADPGVYQMRIELFSGSTFIGASAPRLISEVTEASIENGKVRLAFDNNLTEFADNVRKQN